MESNLIISEHAIDKFIAETGCKKNRQYVESRLRKLFKKAVKTELPSEIKVERFLRNGSEDASYYELSQWRMVVSGCVMVTFERKYPKKK